MTTSKIAYSTNTVDFQETVKYLNLIKGELTIITKTKTGQPGMLELSVEGDEELVNEFVDINELQDAI